MGEHFDNLSRGIGGGTNNEVSDRILVSNPCARDSSGDTLINRNSS